MYHVQLGWRFVVATSQATPPPLTTREVWRSAPVRHLLISNDPYLGVTAEKGIVSFALTHESFGLRVKAR